MDLKDFQKVHKIIHEAIKGTNFEKTTYYCGGCVRDLYLGRAPKSIEITVGMYGGGPALAEYLTRRLNVNRAGVNPLISSKQSYAQFTLGGKGSGIENVLIEAKSTCKNSYTDENGIRPLNLLGSAIEDAHSRDFTMNSLQVSVFDCKYYLDRTGMGFSDIKNKLIRTVIDPDTVFKDDPQRMLRAIRFASEMDFKIEMHTWLGICKNAHRIEDLPPERVREEFNKILISKKADEAIRRLYYCGILDLILPEVSQLKNIKQGKEHYEDAFDHSLTVMMKMKPTIAYRLSGLLHDIGKSVTCSVDFYGRPTFKKHEVIGGELASVAMLYLGYPAAIADSIEKVINLHMRFKQVSIPSKHAIRSFIKNINENDLDLALSLIDADNNSHAEKYCKPTQITKVKDMIEKIREKDTKEQIKLPVTGKDIMKQFTALKGPRLGKAISLLKEFATISPMMTKDEAYSILHDAIKNEQI